MPVTVLHTADGKLDAADAAAFVALKQRLAANPSKVLLHLHGGLVDQASGEKTAAALSGNGPFAYNAPAAYEQIYVVWRTGAFETLRINWTDLFYNDRLYRALFKRLLGFVSGKVLTGDGDGRSVGFAAGLSPAEIDERLKSSDPLPFGDLDERTATEDGRAAVQPLTDQQIRAEISVTLQMSTDFTGAAEDIAAGLETDQQIARTSDHGNAAEGRRSLARLGSDVRAELGPAPADAAGRGLFTSSIVLRTLLKRAAEVAVRVVKRLRSGRGHGIHATIVEEIARAFYGDVIGGAIWGMMKKDASDHFKDGGLGKELVDALATGNHELVLAGHSAGSIWASAFLKAAAAKPAYPPITLVFLAPAVRIVDFADALAQGQQLIRKFRIFAMSDELERADAVLGAGTAAIYPSSLLYLVSGLFEETDGEAAPDAPLLGMQRFIGRSPEWLNDEAEQKVLGDVRTYLASIQNSVVYSKSGAGSGLNCDSTSHGDFDNNPATLASVATFL